MWPWQRKNMHRRSLFWRKLFLFSSVLHFIVLFFMFFIYIEDNFIYNINVNRSILQSGSPVVFLPLRKVVGDDLSKIQVSGNRKSLDSVSVLTSPTKYSKTSLAKLDQKNACKSRRKVPLKEKTAKEKIQKKTIQKKKVSKDQKLAKFKKKKKEQIVDCKTIKSDTKNHSDKLKDKEKVVESKQLNQDIANESGQPIFIGRLELEALEMQEAIEKEITQHWQPPSGLSKDLSCTMKILVGYDGVVKQAKMLKASGVLMYDVSVRTAVANLHLPKLVWGKELNITFNQ